MTLNILNICTQMKHAELNSWIDFKRFVSKLNLICTKLYSAGFPALYLFVYLFLNTVFVAFVDVGLGSLPCCFFFMSLFFCVQKLPLIFFTITVFCVAGVEVSVCGWVLSIIIRPCCSQFSQHVFSSTHH